MNKQHYNTLIINNQQIDSSPNKTSTLVITENQDELSIKSQISFGENATELFTLTKNTNTTIESITYHSPRVKNVNIDASFIKNKDEFLEGQIDYISINGYVYHLEYKDGVWTISYYNKKGQLLYTFNMNFNETLTYDNFASIIEKLICEILTLNLKNKNFYFLVMDNPANILNSIQKNIILFLQSLISEEPNPTAQYQINDETKEYLNSLLTKLTNNTNLMRLLEPDGE